MSTKSYNILIDEEQRVALAELLAMFHFDEDHPLMYWVEMLQDDLPESGPDTIHGFCL